MCVRVGNKESADRCFVSRAGPVRHFVHALHSVCYVFVFPFFSIVSTFPIFVPGPLGTGFRPRSTTPTHVPVPTSDSLACRSVNSFSRQFSRRRHGARAIAARRCAIRWVKKIRNAFASSHPPARNCRDCAMRTTSTRVGSTCNIRHAQYHLLAYLRSRQLYSLFIISI